MRWAVGRSISILNRVVRRLERAQAVAVGGKTSAALDLAIARLGRGATTVVDVGVRWGANDAWWRLHPLASVVGFDPDPEECERLKGLVGSDRSEQYIPAAVGRHDGRATVHLAAKPACSSLYPPDIDVVKRYPQVASDIQEVGTTEVALTTLDSWWDSAGRPNVSFVKLDTQGSELDILSGGERLLAGCLGLEVEVEFNTMYAGQPLFHQVDAFLRAHGFRIWRLGSLCHYSERPMKRRGPRDQVHFDGVWYPTPTGSGRLFWGNAVYFRDYAAVSDESSLLILASLLEGLGDLDGASACLRRLSSVDTGPSVAHLEHVT